MLLRLEQVEKQTMYGRSFNIRREGVSCRLKQKVDFFAGLASNICGDPNDSVNFCLTAPPPEFKFPAKGGRQFAISWAASRLWIRYSVQNDSIFCSDSVCFGKKTH